jgi:predicted metal-dependent phosphoesterase TrpH
VEEALHRGLTGIAVTDHDTTAGLPAAQAAGAVRGLEILGGVELSCEREGREVHILGYGMRAPEEIERVCGAIRRHRETRMEQMVEKAVAEGLAVTYEEVSALAGEGAVGRPHLARLLVEKGYVKSIGEAFERYLGDEGRVHVPKQRLTSADAIALIRRTGGIPVVAHPGLHGVEDFLAELVEEGARGIEVHYPKHKSAQTARLRSFAEARGLLMTGGSDYHGDAGHDRRLGRPAVAYGVLEALRAAIERAAAG